MVRGQESCQDMYKAAFKLSGGSAKPDKVPGLYLEYCKKNMKSSSAKAMDVQCAPFVKKVAEKMQFVPPDTDVTPQLVCKGLKAIKEEFKDFAIAKEAELNAKAATETSSRSAVVEEAKALKKELETVISELTSTWRKQLVYELGERARRALSNSVNANLAEVSKDASNALVKSLVDAAGLGAKGLETKLLQKTTDVVGQWAAQASSAATAGAKKEL